MSQYVPQISSGSLEEKVVLITGMFLTLHRSNSINVANEE